MLIYWRTWLMLIFMLSLTSYLWKSWDAARTKSNQPAFSHQFCRGSPTNNTITQLKDIFIIAPYYDSRSGTQIRVISIVRYENVRELYCLFCCKNNKRRLTRAEVDIHSDRFGFPYGTADLVCLEPKNCYPQYMSLKASLDLDAVQLPLFEIKNRNRETRLLEFTVCLSPMYGRYNNVLQFVQSIEMYKILGAEKVMVYKNKCSPLMEKVLGVYVADKIIEIVQWPIHLYLNVSSSWLHSKDAKDIGYYGQITALNDCIYRNMYRSRYVLLNDFDEIIIPIKDADWKSMMRRLQKQNPGAGVFLFENTVFPNTLFASAAGEFNFSFWSTIPGVNMLQHVYKEPNNNSEFNNRKMIVDPRKVIQTSVHSVLKMYGISVTVSNDTAINFHCKLPGHSKWPMAFLIKDTILWRYNTSLISNTNSILHKANILEANSKR